MTTETDWHAEYARRAALLAHRRQRLEDILRELGSNGLVLNQKRGSVIVDSVRVSEEDEAAGRLRAMINRHRGFRYTPAGTYKQLFIGGALMMSNTPDELRDQEPVFEAVLACERPRVLINGLGLGLTVRGVIMAGASHVDVVEFNRDVIDVVGLVVGHQAAINGCTLDIHHADALTYRWKPGLRWDVAWHDIWPDICSENLPEMQRLHRRYARRTNWQGSWSHDLTLAARERGGGY